MAQVELDGVAHTYPIDSKYDPISDVSITVEDGEYFCLVGPSDSGITSVLRAIAGLDTPDDGEVSIGGELVNEVPPNQRGASMLFKNLALYPNQTGFENIGHPLKVRGVSEAERRERVEEIAERLEISHLLDRKPETFSGGEKQRVGIARAIVDDSDVYLLDEPLGGLDAKLRRQLRVLLKRLHEDLEGTFVHATQDQQEAMSVADRMAVLKGGHVQQIGTPTELYDEPNNRFVAEYIGNPKINFLDGRLENGTLQFGPFSTEVPPDLQGGSEGQYTVGVRPQDITIHQEAENGTVEGTVDVTEPIGASTIVDVDFDEFTVRTITKQPWVHELAPGSTVFGQVGIEDVYLFDVETEQVLYTPPR